MQHLNLKYVSFLLNKPGFSIRTAPPVEQASPLSRIYVF